MIPTLLISISLLLGSCATMQMSSTTARPTPVDRLLAYQNSLDKNSAELIIVRDKGMTSSLCYYGIMIDQKLSARIDVAEKATFQVPPGKRHIKIVRDPKGSGVCSYGDDQTEKDITFRVREVQKLRLSLSWGGDPSLNSYTE